MHYALTHIRRTYGEQIHVIGRVVTDAQQHVQNGPVVIESVVRVSVAEEAKIVLHAHDVQFHQTLHHQRRHLRLKQPTRAHIHVPVHLSEHFLNHQDSIVNHHKTKHLCVLLEILPDLVNRRVAQTVAQHDAQLAVERTSSLVTVRQNLADFRHAVLVVLQNVLDQHRVVVRYSESRVQIPTLIADGFGGSEVPQLAVVQHHLGQRALEEFATAQRGERDDELRDDHAVGRGHGELAHVLPTVNGVTKALPFVPGPEEVGVGDVAGEPLHEQFGGVEAQLVSLHAQRVHVLEDGGGEALDEEVACGGGGGGDGLRGEVAEDVLRLQLDVLGERGVEEGGEEHLVGDGREVVRQRLVIHLVQGGDERGQSLDELGGVLPRGVEETQQVLRVRRGERSDLDVLGYEQALVPRERRERRPNARVKDLAEEVVHGSGRRLLRVTRHTHIDRRPLDNGGHERLLGLQQLGEARADGRAVLLVARVHLALLALLRLRRALQHLEDHAQNHRVRQVERLQTHAQRGVGGGVVQVPAHLLQCRVQLHEEVVLRRGSLRRERGGVHVRAGTPSTESGRWRSRGRQSPRNGGRRSTDPCTPRCSAASRGARRAGRSRGGC